MVVWGSSRKVIQRDAQSAFFIIKTADDHYYDVCVYSILLSFPPALLYLIVRRTVQVP